jgi:hypothetical protein
MLKPLYLYYCLMQRIREKNTIVAAHYPMIANAISQYENEVSASELWNLIKDSICRQTGDKWYMQQNISRDQR